MDKPNPTLWLAPLLAAHAACSARPPAVVAATPLSEVPDARASLAPTPTPDPAAPDAEALAAEPLAAEPFAEGDPMRCEPRVPLDVAAWDEPDPASEPASAAPRHRAERSAATTHAASATRATHAASATRTASATRADDNAGDALDASTIRSVVRSHSGGFMGCYQLGLGRDPHLQGRVTTRFDIDPKGKISELTIAANELPDCSVIECIRDHFITIEFPPPGNVVTVLYPLVFGHAD